MKPPPPGPAANGTVTPIAAAVATAASMALPPCLSTSMPAWLASRLMDATAPPVPTATGCFLTAPGARAAALAANGRAASAAARAEVTETVIRRRCIATSRDGGVPFPRLVLPGGGDANQPAAVGPAQTGGWIALCRALGENGTSSTRQEAAPVA